jgi:hypothetical protein
VVVQLRTAMAEAGLSIPELWLRYFALGGTATAAQMEAHMDGEEDRAFVVDDDLQHDTLVQALNERFMELHRDDALPYERG